MTKVKWAISFVIRLLRQIVAQLNYTQNRRVLFLNYRWESELSQRDWRERIYGKKQWWSRFLEDVVGIKNGVFRVAFFGVFGPRHLQDIPLFCPKIWLTEEDTEHRFKDYDDYCLGRVDLSLGFKNIDHPNYVRFPYWIYQFIDPGFSGEKEQLGLCGPTPLLTPRQFCEKINSGCRLGDKKFFASIVARHDSHGSGAGLRAQLMDGLNEVGEVVSAGKWRKNTSVLKNEYSDDLGAFLADCRYNICIENTNSSGYVTEKVFQALLASSVPIYWGGGDYLEPEVLTGNGILRMLGRDPRAVKEKVANLESDSSFREDWLGQPILTPWAVEWIEERIHTLKSRIDQVLNI